MAKRKQNTTKKHNITCPNCQHESSVHVEKLGFRSIACRKCKYLIHDMDKYFNIVYGGADITRPDDVRTRALHTLYGLAVIAIFLLAYAIWVCYGIMFISYVPMAYPIVTPAIAIVLVVFGIPYIIMQRLLTWADISV